MNYVLTEDKIRKLVYIASKTDIMKDDIMRNDSVKKLLNQSVEEVAEGEVNDLCHDFGIWATKRWTPNEKYKVYIEVIKD
jgi:hypothetical protein